MSPWTAKPAARRAASATVWTLAWVAVTGGAAVKPAGAAGVVQGEHGKGQGQGAGQVVCLGDAQGGAPVVPVGEEGVEGPDGPGRGAVCQGQGGQQRHQGGLGVMPLLGGGAVGVLPGAGHVEGLPLLGAGAGDRPLQGQGLEGLLHLAGGERPRTVAWALGGTMFSRVPPEKAATRGRAAAWGQAAWKVGW